MTEFEVVLQQCLRDLEEGRSSVDECLRRHPDFAPRLEPILLTSAYLSHGREARLSEAFKSRVRADLVRRLNAHPRRPARPGFRFARVAAGLAVLLLAFLTAGTAYAQRALPGEAFYAWKLASEDLWHMLAPDPVNADLVIARRRLAELLAVRDNPVLYSRALDAYLEASARLKAGVTPENAAQILAELDSQTADLKQSGILRSPPLPAAGGLPAAGDPTATVTVTAPATVNIPQVTITPGTAIPAIVPTVQAPARPTVEAPPVIIPTVQDSIKDAPTLEIPPPIR